MKFALIILAAAAIKMQGDEAPGSDYVFTCDDYWKGKPWC